MPTPKRNHGQTARLSGRVNPKLVDMIREEAARLDISQSNYTEMCIINALEDGLYWINRCKSCGYVEPEDEYGFLGTRYHLTGGGPCPSCGDPHWLEGFED